MIREAKLKDFNGVKRLYGQLNPDDPAVSDGRLVGLNWSVLGLAFMLAPL